MVTAGPGCDLADPRRARRRLVALGTAGATLGGSRWGRGGIQGI
jgi:hypothetical protein